MTRYAQVTCNSLSFLFYSSGDPGNSLHVFLKDVKQAIEEFDSLKGTPPWDEQQQFILEVVLPSLEEHWRKSCAKRISVYSDLVQIGFSRTSSNVVRHSLRQLRRLMQLDNLESGQHNLLGLERILTLSVSSVFKEEGHEERLLRLSVYRQILVLLIIQKTQGRLSADDIKKDLSQLKSYLGKYYNQTKDFFRYSMEFVQKAIRCLVKPSKKFKHSDVRAFLNECQEKSKPLHEGNMELSFIKTLKNPKSAKQIEKNKWFALHCAILYLHVKVSNYDHWNPVIFL